MEGSGAAQGDSVNLGPSNSPLVNYALKGLERCWLREHGRWSHIYHLDGRDQPNESLPQSDVFYTLNVLLGISRLKEGTHKIDTSAIFERNVLQLLTLPVAKYAFGMALWTAAQLKLDIPANLRRHLKVLLSEPKYWWSFRAQDLGMILIGILAEAKVDRKELYRFAEPLYSFLLGRYHTPSGLFFDSPRGLRRRFASFASQTYLTLACYWYGEFAGSTRAVEIANACTQKLIGLQGPNGEWPWFFDAETGRVLDFYEIYSVHQYGMAPAFLEHAEQHGVRTARDALIKGFHWVLGSNQLGEPMLVPEMHLSLRSHTRKRELHTNKLRMIRAAYNVYFGGIADFIDPVDIQIRRECRSYELGWILWSFGNRADLPQLTHNPVFIDALKQYGGTPPQLPCC